MDKAKIIVSVKKIYKNYKKKNILKNIDMEIREGEIYGLVGENGAGKTTLLRILTGLASPTQGEVQLFGKNSEKEKAKVRIKVGAIIEQPALYLNMNARQNLEVQRIELGIKDKYCIEQVLKRVRLTDTGNKKVKDFSLGMKQRLGLALALMGDPELLILDEPLNGLDPSGIIELRELLKELNQKQGITILISSHILNELSQIATQYGFMHKGKLIQEISVSKLLVKCKKYIVLKIDCSHVAKKVLQEDFGIDHLEVVSEHVINIYDQSLDIGGITKKLVEKGIKIREVSVNTESLEDYFMKLIGNSI